MLPSPSCSPLWFCACLSGNKIKLPILCMLRSLACLPTACSKKGPRAGSSNAVEKQTLLVRTHHVHKSAQSSTASLRVRAVELLLDSQYPFLPQGRAGAGARQFIAGSAKCSLALKSKIKPDRLCSPGL